MAEEKEAEEVIAPSASERKMFIEALREKFINGEAHLSFSTAKHFRNAPSAFITNKMNKTKQTDSMLRGNMVDLLILTPDKFDEKYTSDEDKYNELVASGSSKPRATAAYKEWRSTAESVGLTIVSADLLKVAKNMAEAALSNRAVQLRLAACPQRQVKVDFVHQGIKWVGYIDAMGDNEKLDLKSMKSAAIKDVMREIVNMDYWLQAAIYISSDGEIVPYSIIAVDTSCNVSVIRLDEDFILWALDQFDKLCREFNLCLHNNDFHRSFDYRASHEDGYHIMNKPPYLN